MLDERIPRREFTKRAAVAGIGVSGLSSLLAACGGGASGNGAPAGTATIPAKATGGIELLGWDANAPTAAGDALRARRLAWLKANPGATLEFQTGPVDGFTAVVTTRSRARKLADVIEMLGDRYYEAAFPALKPLSRDMFPKLKDSLSLWESTTFDAEDPERLAGVPIGGSGSVWYYNKALFEKAGLDPDTTPETWAELSDMVDRLKAAGIQPVTLSGDYIGALNLWYPHAAQFFPTSSDVLAFRRGEIPLTDERFVHSLEPLVQAKRDGWFPKGFLSKKASDMEADFASGKAAMVCGLVGGLANWPVWDRKLGKDAYGTFAAPLMPKASERVFFWFPDFMYSINKDSDNLPAALSFVNFLASREGLTIGLKLGGAMPNRTDIDVAAVTGSQGAAAIAELVRTLPLVDVPMSFLEPAATEGMFKTTGPAIESGDIDGFLSALQQQNQV